MTKRFNIRMALEKDLPGVTPLAVDTEAELTPEEKAVRDSAERTLPPPADDTTDTPDDAADTPAPAGAGDDDTDKSTPEEEGTETDVVDIDDSIKDKDAKSEATKGAVDQAEAMEKIANQMQSALATGGLSEIGFRTAERSLKHHYEVLGLEYNRSSYPSLESFNSYSSRERQTKVAIEAIDEAISRVWLSVKESITRMLDNVKAILGKLVFMFKTYEGQIKALRVALNKTRLEDPKRDTYANMSVIRSLSIGKAFNPKASLSAVSKLLSETVHQFKSSCPSNLKSIKETFAASVYTEKLAKLNRLKLTPSDIFSGLKKQSNGESQKDVDHYTFSDLPGSILVQADLPKPGLSDEDYVTCLRSCYVTVANDGPVNYSAKETRVYSKNEVAEVLDQAALVVNNYWGVWREFEKQIESNDIEMIYKMIDQIEVTKKHRDYYSSFNDTYGTNIDVGSSYIDIKKIITAYMIAIDNVHFNFGIHATRCSTQTVSAAISFSDNCIRAYM